MRAAVCTEPGKIVLKDISIPTPGPGEALIRVMASGISDTDVRTYMGKNPGVSYPVIPGHEFSGEIAELGRDVDNFEIGDEVIVEPLFPCGECPACLAGCYNLCDSLLMTGCQVNGSFAEYAVARAAFLYPKDEPLSYAESALVEPLAVAIHSIKRAGVGIGDTAVILGAGPIGLLTIQVAIKAGARVIVTDISDDKLHLSASLGAHYVLNSDTSSLRELVMAATKNRGADFVIECMGTPESLAQTAGLVRKGGTIVAVGWTGNEIDQMPMTRIATNEINLLGSVNYCRDFPVAIELAISGEVNLNSIISHEFELSEVDVVLGMLSGERHEIIKGIIRFSDSISESRS